MELLTVAVKNNAKAEPAPAACQVRRNDGRTSASADFVITSLPNIPPTRSTVTAAVRVNGENALPKKRRLHRIMNRPTTAVRTTMAESEITMTDTMPINSRR